MKTFLFYIAILFSLEIFACDCDIINPTLDFYESNYVFKGVVDSKIYSQDSLTYIISFKVLKHYKQNDENPEQISFTLKSESQYTGQWTSCDWSTGRYYSTSINGRTFYRHYYSSTKRC